ARARVRSTDGGPGRRSPRCRGPIARWTMPYVMVDVEADGPIPADYSMVCFGAVVVEPDLRRTFYGRTRPISDRYLPDALAISGFTREEHLGFDDPALVMARFEAWLAELGGRPMFVS